MIPGCPQLTILHTSLGTIFITFDKRVDGLPDILSRDIRSEQDLLPTLKYLEHQNAQSLRELHEKVDRGGCSTWLRVQNDQDYLHPVHREAGLFVRRNGELIYEYHCNMIEVPIAEATVCMHWIPVLVQGSKFMASLDSRVITPHISVKPCNDIYPTLVRSVSSGWISVSTHVIQVAAPKKMRISSSYRTIEKVTTLYTQEELQQWEDYMQLPSFQHSQHQRLLNELCTGDSCSYGS